MFLVVAVVFLENELIYGQQFPISDEALSLDFLLPIGKGKVERQGKHITLASHSIGVKICMEAAKELEQSGIDCEVRFPLSRIEGNVVVDPRLSIFDR